MDRKQLVVTAGIVAIATYFVLAFPVMFWMIAAQNPKRGVSSPPMALQVASAYSRTPLGIFIFAVCLYRWVKFCRHAGAFNQQAAENDLQNSGKPPIPEP